MGSLGSSGGEAHVPTAAPRPADADGASWTAWRAHSSLGVLGLRAVWGLGLRVLNTVAWEFWGFETFWGLGLRGTEHIRVSGPRSVMMLASWPYHRQLGI